MGITWVMKPNRTVLEFHWMGTALQKANKGVLPYIHIYIDILCVSIYLYIYNSNPKELERYNCTETVTIYCSIFWGFL